MEPLGASFSYHVHDLSHIVQFTQLMNLEADGEPLFNGEHYLHMRQTIPIWHIFGGRRAIKLNVVVVEDIPDTLLDALEYLVLVQRKLHTPKKSDPLFRRAGWAMSMRVSTRQCAHFGLPSGQI